MNDFISNQQVFEVLKPYSGWVIFVAVVIGILFLIYYISTSIWFKIMAEKTGIPKSHSWLSFIPIGRQWLLGKISGQSNAHIIFPVFSLIGMIIFLIIFAPFLSGQSLTLYAQKINQIGFKLISGIIAAVSIGIELWIFYHIAKRFNKPESFTPICIIGVINFPIIKELIGLIVGVILFRIFGFEFGITLLIFGAFGMYCWYLSAIKAISRSNPIS